MPSSDDPIIGAVVKGFADRAGGSYCLVFALYATAGDAERTLNSWIDPLRSDPAYRLSTLSDFASPAILIEKPEDPLGVYIAIEARNALITVVPSSSVTELDQLETTVVELGRASLEHLEALAQDPGAYTQNLAPEALLTFLESSPFPDTELPAGQSSAIIERVEGNTSLFAGANEALGGVRVNVGADTEIYYLVYPNEVDATTVFHQWQTLGDQLGNQPGTAVLAPPGFAYPAQMIVAPVFGGDDQPDGTCVVQIGNVLVVGMISPEPDLASPRAIDLARAGVTHFEKLLGDPVNSDVVEQIATPSASTAVPNISIYEVVGRAQAAVQQAGTYKYEDYWYDESGQAQLNFAAEAVIDGGRKQQSADGAILYIDSTGKFYTQDPSGTWIGNYPAGGSIPDPLTRFLGTSVTEWTLLGTEPYDVRDTYVIERAYDFKMTERTETIWVDAGTFLPVKSTDKDAQAGAASGEITYSDFGAPVDVEIPPEALAPTPSPTPQLGPSPSDTPTQIAEGFIDAVTAGDFAAVARYFALDRQPQSWDDAFLRNVPGARADGCRGVDYQTVERQINSAGTVVAVNFLFASPCATTPSGEATEKVSIKLESSTGRWYVLEAVVGITY